MRTSHRLITLATLLAALPACGKKGGDDGGTSNPDTSPGAAAAVDPTKASAEAKEDFARTAKRYQGAKADGVLSGADCEQMAEAWMGVYKQHGKQMAVAYFNAGAVWEECGDPQKAEGIYQRLTSEVPAYDMAYNNLGVIYWNRRQETKALDYFKKAVDVNPRTNAPRNNLAAALRNKYSTDPQQADFTKAEGEIQRVLAVDTNNRIAYENLARLYYDRGRMKDKSYLVLANLVVTQGIRVVEDAGKKSADLYNLAGLLRMQENNQIEALKAFKKAVEAEPSHADANMNMALIAVRFRDYATAETSFKTAMKDKRMAKNIEAYLGLGVAQRGLRKFSEAEESFKKAQGMDKGDPRAIYNLAILYHEHLATREDLDLEGIKKHYTTAKGFFQQFLTAAGPRKEYATLSGEAKSRVEQIDESFRTWAEMKELEKKAAELAELARKQEEEEKNRLLAEEKAAIEAAMQAEAEAKKAAAGAPKAEDKKAEDKKAEDKKAEDKKAEDKPADKGGK
jgi:tetratricopeptide (TPR) repeat protein